MADEDVVKKLRVDAANCRRLAEAASDPEGADALLQIAADLDVASSVLREEASPLAMRACNSGASQHPASNDLVGTPQCRRGGNAPALPGL